MGVALLERVLGHHLHGLGSKRSEVGDDYDDDDAH